MERIVEIVKNTIEENKLIDKGDKIVVALSGGPDSMALLYILSGLKKYYNYGLAIAHLDHMLRGKASAADANFAKKMATKLDIPLIMEKCNVRNIAGSQRMSVEEAAREARYAFFERAAEKSGANKIATAHNMDDQAETVLMRLIKGSGALGLSGIPYKRRLAAKWVIRPLLDVKRADIEKYLKRCGIPSRRDASNFKMLYLRNKIRHELIPFLEKQFNLSIKESISVAAKNLRWDYDYLSTVSRRAFQRLVSRTNGVLTINIGDLSRLHIALQRLVARQMIFELKGDLKKITYRHWQGIERMLVSSGSAIVLLPGNIRAERIRGRLIFSKTLSDKSRQAKKFTGAVNLAMPGEVSIPGLGIKIRSEIVKKPPAFKKGGKRKMAEYINGDLISGGLLKIRTRREGDRMKPFGMKTSKKLHDIFVDEKVPREIRDTIPLIISGKTILWAGGVKLSECSRIEKYTKKVIKLSMARLASK